MSTSVGAGGRRPWLVLGLIALGIALAGLLVARVGVERRALRRALPQLEGRIELPGLADELVIVRDVRGIAHVRAKNEADAWFGLGVVHAQDRLAQMTWLVRAARGRTAEVIGRDGLEIDRRSRTLGLGRLADRRAQQLDPAVRGLLEAYSAGVNAWIARIEAGRAPRPIALERLDVRPEPWSPADSLAVSKLLAWGLDGSIEGTLVLQDLVRRLGGFAARPFLPPGAAAELVPVPLPRVQAEGPPVWRALVQEDEAQTREPARAGEGADPLRAAAGLGGRSVGSSAWVVAGHVAANRHPLLAGDVHLPPTAPALLYEAHVSAPGLEVAGAGPPGLPVFWSGHNGRVAWAATHARAAVADLYEETLDATDGGRYRVGRAWRPVVTREERIAVRGGGDETLLVRETHHGPLVNGLLPPGRPPLALAWSGARPGDGVTALARAARARDAAGFRAALADHAEPAFVFVFADVGGAGGRQLAGWLPDRAMATALLPVPGRSPWYDWRGRIPFHELHYTPLVGRWLVAADQPLGDARVEWWWRPGTRAARVEALLAEAVRDRPIEAATLAQLQSDVVSGGAPERVRLLLELAGDPEEMLPEAREVVALLAAWDGASGPDSRGAAAWHVLLGSLLRRALAAPFGEDLLARYLALRGVHAEALLDALLEAAFAPEPEPDAVVDRATLAEATRHALRQTGLTLRVALGPNDEKWSWGRLHPLRFTHFGWTPAAWEGPLADASWAYGGDAITVSVAEYDPDAPYDVTVVSAYRLVVDLASPQIALSSLAPGVSEHPADPRRRAGVDRWLAGRPGLLATHPFVVDEGAQARLELVPAAEP